MRGIKGIFYWAALTGVGVKGAGHTEMSKKECPTFFEGATDLAQ